MGFRLNRTFKLRWGGDLEGLEIDTRSASVAVVEEVKGLVFRRGEGEDREAGEARLAEIIVSYVTRWNFEDESGQELPVSIEVLRQQEPAVVREIAKEWYLAVAGVSAPLDLGSTDTAPSELEPSLPMDVL